MQRLNGIASFVALIAALLTAFPGSAQAQVAKYETHFGSVNMPSEVGQHVVLASLPLGSATQNGLASFDFQAVGSFKGEWLGGDQESFDLYICDAADCEGSMRSQLGRVILVPIGDIFPPCLTGALTLRGTFARASGTVYDAIFSGMLEGLWTGRSHTNLVTCQNHYGFSGDGMILRDGGVQIVTGPIGALPSLSEVPIDTTGTLFLVLTTTLVIREYEYRADHTGQMSLMRAVVYPQ